MNRMWLWIIGVIVIAAAVVGIVIATKDDNSQNNPTANTNPPTSTQNTTTPNSSSSSQSAEATDKVSIVDMSFSPAKITVKKGTTVTWTNNDTTTHTVTSHTEHGPNSSNIAPGGTYSFTFSDDGTFDYHCSIHPEMTGSVTVTD